jgi:hypothetical protein
MKQTLLIAALVTTLFSPAQATTDDVSAGSLNYSCHLMGSNSPSVCFMIITQVIAEMDLDTFACIPKRPSSTNKDAWFNQVANYISTTLRLAIDKNPNLKELTARQAVYRIVRIGFCGEQ